MTSFNFSIYEDFKNNIKAKSCLFTLLLLVLFGIFAPKSPVSDPNVGSRLQTLNYIVESANRGYFFQIEDNVAMEVHWEDPGMGVALSYLGMVYKAFGADLNLEIVYCVQFLLIALVFLLPFYGRLFQFETWVYPILPVALFSVISINLLHFSWNQYWTSTLGGVWVGISLLHIWTHFQSSKEDRKTRQLQFLLSIALIGMIGGLLGLFRSSLNTEIPVAISAFIVGAFMLSLPARVRKVLNIPRHLSATRSAAISLLVFIASFQVPGVIVDLSWEARDHYYEMENRPRNGIHPTWAPLYLGLGYVENNYGIAWDDGVGDKHVSREFPNVQYGTEEYEQALKTLYIRTIKSDPELLVRSMIAKSSVMLRNHWIEIGGSYLLLFLMFVYCPERRMLALSGFGWSLLSILPPVLCFPHPLYALSFTAGLWFWGIYSVFALSKHFRESKGKHGSDVFGKEQKRKLGLSLMVPVLVAALPPIFLYAMFLAMPTEEREAPVGKNAQFRWITKGESFNDVKKIDFELVDSKNEQTIEFSMPLVTEPIDAIRFDPINDVSHTFDIEKFDLKDENGEVKYSYLFEDEEAVESEWEIYNATVDTLMDGRVGISPTTFDPFILRTVRGLEFSKVELKFRFSTNENFGGWLGSWVRIAR